MTEATLKALIVQMWLEVYWPEKHTRFTSAVFTTGCVCVPLQACCALQLHLTQEKYPFEKYQSLKKPLMLNIC